MGVLDSLKREYEDALASVKPRVVGLQNMQRMNSNEPVIGEDVVTLSRLYERRGQRIQAVVDAIVVLETRIAELASDGHPTQPTLKVKKDVKANLQNDRDSVNLVLDLFTTDAEAVAAIITAGEPQPKAE